MTRARPSSEDLWVCHLGTLPYSDGIAVQETLRARRQANEIPDTLLLLEHRPVYTRGRRSSAQELPFPEAFYRERGIEVVDVDRGGRITYHGPGQLVGYPIMAVGDVHSHLRMMEGALVDALAHVGVSARSRHEEGIDYTGVWVQERKIASIGVHVQRGVSTHGFAINVSNDLDPFTWVVACGLPDVTMTSLQRELDGAGEGIACVRKRVAYAFCEAHGRRQRLVSATRLGIDHAQPIRRASERAPHPDPRPEREPVPAYPLGHA
jgi:lipoyl(octanoyl) transferase